MRKNLNKKNLKISAVLSAALISGMVYMTGCGGGGGGGGGTGSLSKCSTPIDASFTDGLEGQTRIGGATTSVELLNVADANWTLYNTANELHATMVDSPESNISLEVEGYIHDIVTIEYVNAQLDLNGTFALLAMGEEGIGVVDVTNPAAMVQRTDLSVKVNYEKTGITIAEGSGSIADINISSSRAPISSLAVYNEGTDINPSWQLIIGDEGFGLHKTALNNLFSHTLDPDDNATLFINSDLYTLQYAGENPWGGPKSLTVVGEGTNTKLFVAQGFLGMGIYDPVNLVKVGHYNLYTDPSVEEDWFTTLDVSSDGTLIDSCTGMPDYRQASLEINGTTPTPWADFEFAGGKYYYDARNVEVATVGASTYAYIAYGLAGLVAVDVSNYTTTIAPCGNTGTYLGYVPAMPVKGPTDRLIGNQGGQGGTGTLFSRAGAGMLQDAGVVDVKVDTKVDPTKVFFTDHFGGLMVVDHAEDPVTFWKEGNGDWGAVNDTDPGTEHVPSYDFVTSYNMTPDPLGGDEALPTFTTEAPILLATGEVGGHGNALALMDNMDLNNTNTSPADVVMAAGAGGLNFIDLYDGALTQYDFNVTDYLATTDEIGAAPVGLDLPKISVGHAAGVGTYDNILYLADGPHGMMAWKVADESCNNIATDQVRLVGNTLQSESVIGDINPTPHADEVVVTNDGVTKSAMVASLSAGLRRVNVDVLGTEGAPELLYPTSGDIFEHSIEETKLPGISYEDRVYDVEVRGNLAYTADGLSGVTVYNLDETPEPDGSNPAIVVSNIKGTGDDRINNATGIALSGDYAFVAGGATGITVIDISDPSNLSIVKTFQPIKWEELAGHNADGVAVDVAILGDFAFFTYDSFGVLAYRISDLIDRNYVNLDDVMPGDPTSKNRPNAVGYFKVQNADTYTTSLVTDFADWGGGAAGIDAISATNGKKIIYVAYGDAGVFKLDWTNLWTSPAPATSYETISPILEQHANTAGKATDVVVWNGRVYVADGAGGLVLLK